jgi:hypothetical protein
MPSKEETMASLHSEQYRTPVTEAVLWCVWTAARLTGGATALRKLARYTRQVNVGAVTAQLRRHGRRWWRSVTQRGHRLLIRIDLAAADLMAGPTPDIARARLVRRAPWLITGVIILANILYLAVR